MRKASILSVASAVPPHKISQLEAGKMVQQALAGYAGAWPDSGNLFRFTGIETRYIAQPLSWYVQEHSFAERNQCYQQVAAELLTRAGQTAIQQAGVMAEDIQMVIVVSSTGLSTPTLDCMLMQTLGLSPYCKRQPLWGLGCAGGAAGLARAAESVRQLAGGVVLLAAVELCSLNFQKSDYSKANIAAAGLFADGAAAVVLAGRGSGVKVEASFSTLFPDTEALMGWDVTNEGLRVRFSRDIPSFVQQHAASEVDKACRSWQLSRDNIDCYIVHPGGRKVLAAYAESLALEAETFAEAAAILRDYGNVSSVSILLELERVLQKQHPIGSRGLCLAMGPGFCMEQVLLGW